MHPASERWKETTASEFPWEREALQFVRERLPDQDPCRAWSNFEFVAEDGSVNEVDLLVLTPKGFFLVEIKSRPGVLRGDAGTWTWEAEGRRHSEDNPLILANRKAKRLAGLLRRQKALDKACLPFLQAMVFCSAPGLSCQLDPSARPHVHLRDREEAEGQKARAGIGPDRIRVSSRPSLRRINGHMTEPRLVSLDVFRGLTIAGMILVNNPGSWGAVYRPLTHAEWHGWTPTDLIFPFFLFAAGVSIVLALAPRLERGEPAGRLVARIVGRAVTLFALGLLLAGFPVFDLATIRIPGVLQRIAACYLAAALLLVLTRHGRPAVIIAAAFGVLLLGYWALMTLVPVPGFGVGDLGKEGNLAAYIDRAVLGPHIWQAARVYDPEGILSTLPAIATTLAGVLTGLWVRSPRPLDTKAAGMAAAGLAAIALGLVWDQWFPINKPLWTSSYVVFTAGAGLLGLAACCWLVEIRRWRGWTTPFVIFGTNAIAAFFLSTLLARLLILIPIRAGEHPAVSLHHWIYASLFAPWAEPATASLLFALAYVLLWLAAMSLLHRRGIFIRV